MPLKRVQVSTREVQNPPTHSPVTFDVTAIDASGNLIRCGLSMIFVTLDKARKHDFLELTIKPIYANHNTVEFNQQRITWPTIQARAAIRPSM
jgi:hypothetical protein